MWLKGATSDETGKINQVETVKDLVNHTNESELYPAGMEETMQVFRQEGNIMTFFQGENSGSRVCERLERGELEAGISEGNVHNNPGNKIQGGGNKW